MNTEVTTEEMNEVIARFMGITREEYNESGHMEYEWRPTCADSNWCFFEPPPFNRSWNWLMPVGKMIRDLLNDMQKKRPAHTACHGDLIEVDIHCAVSEYDIVNAHKNMYIFIKWYNEYQQKQNNEQSTE